MLVQGKRYQFSIKTKTSLTILIKYPSSFLSLFAAKKGFFLSLQNNAMKLIIIDRFGERGSCSSEHFELMKRKKLDPSVEGKMGGCRLK